MPVTAPEASVDEILFEHEVLRVLLTRFGEAAERYSQGTLGVQDLRDSARTLQAVLEAHGRRDEEALILLLRANGGQARLDDLCESQSRVAELLRKVRCTLPDAPAADTVSS